MRDVTPNLGVLHVRGPQAERAMARFSAGRPGWNSLATDAACSMDGGILCRLAADEYFYLVEPPEKRAAAYARLDDILTGQRAVLSDITHGYGKLELSGPGVAALLPRLCGLDFSDLGFADGRVAQTSLAKVHATLVRTGEKSGGPKYYLLVDRSLSAYVWETIVAVMQAFKAVN